MIYFDNAATTLRKPPEVVRAVAEAMESFGNSGRSAHSEALTASRSIYHTREQLAALFDCPRADHVAFTANSTEALNIALFGLLLKGDHVISTDWEHNSVLRPLYRLQREQAVELSFLPADRQGQLDYSQLQRQLRKNTRMLVCTHGSNLTGDLADLQCLSEFAQANHLLLVIDASQTAGVFPLSMQEFPIDVLCFTGHKSLMGPQGTGGLCLRPGVELRPWKVGGTGVQTYLPEQPPQMPTRLEAGTLNGHGLAGLSAALDFIERTGMETIRRHESLLLQRFHQGLRSIPGITVYGKPEAALHCPVLALNVRDLDSGEVSDALAEDYGIATRPGAHCAPRMHRALGTEDQGAVRFSFGWYNTETEVDAALTALEEIARC